MGKCRSNTTTFLQNHNCSVFTCNRIHDPSFRPRESASESGHVHRATDSADVPSQTVALQHHQTFFKFHARHRARNKYITLRCGAHIRNNNNVYTSLCGEVYVF